jgi:hypothetical protein
MVFQLTSTPLRKGRIVPAVYCPPYEGVQKGGSGVFRKSKDRKRFLANNLEDSYLSSDHLYSAIHGPWRVTHLRVHELLSP